MGGLFSSAKPEWDGRRTPYNLMLDRAERELELRELEELEWEWENQQRTTSSYTTTHQVRNVPQYNTNINNNQSWGYESRNLTSYTTPSYTTTHQVRNVPQYNTPVNNNQSCGCESCNLTSYTTPSYTTTHQVRNVPQYNTPVNNNQSCGCESCNLTSYTTSRSSNVSTQSSKSTHLITNETYKKYQNYLYSVIINESRTLSWNNDTTNGNYRLVQLDSCSTEYFNIQSIFSRHRSPTINIIKIERIENLYLLGLYYIRKLEYMNRSLNVVEKTLFHGTKSQYVDSICSDNFDWRLHGNTKGNIFGKGVSFTPKSSYANHYCDKNMKVMFVVKVLVSNSCVGNRDMIIPPYINSGRALRYDTSVKPEKNDVFVKYSDDEFYPAYLIHYTGKIYYPNKGFAR